jgi:hypothetical protein
VLEYYDGFALGMQTHYYNGTPDEIDAYCTEFYGQNVAIYICP